MLLLSTDCLTFGCAALSGVPQGSKLLAVFKGNFNGVYNEGSVEVKLYQAPDGGKLFAGHFDEEASYLNFRGEMQADELKGEILLPYEGSISAKISANGESLSGTYKITLPPFDHGTWQAEKQ